MVTTSRGATTIEQLIENLRPELEPEVKRIEASVKVTQHHYGAYMSLIATIAQDTAMRQLIGLALIRFGANKQGVKSAMQILGVL